MSEDNPKSDALQSYTLRVLRAEGLHSSTKTPKYFVKISVGSQEYHTAARESATPSWEDNEVENKFPLLKVAPSSSVTFRVLRKSRFRDVVKGTVSVRLSDIPLISERVLPLVKDDPKGKDKIIHLAVRLESITSDTSTPQPSSAVGSKAPHLGKESPSGPPNAIIPGTEVQSDAAEVPMASVAQVVSEARIRVDEKHLDRKSAVPSAVDAISDAANSDITSSLKNVASRIKVVANVMDKVAELHPYLNLAWSVVSSVHKAYEAQVKLDQSVAGLVTKMEYSWSLVEASAELKKDNHPFRESVKNIVNQTIECATFVREFTDHGFAGRAISNAVNPEVKERVAAMEKAFEELQSAFNTGVNLHVAFAAGRILDVVINEAQKSTLQRLRPTFFDAANRPSCLPGTRVETLASIEEWLLTPAPQNVLWLHGIPGSGKSTVATTIALTFGKFHRRGAWLHFNRNNSHLSDPTTVIRTLAYQLAHFHPRIRDRIVQQLNENHGIEDSPFSEQFECLLEKPLAGLDPVDLGGPVIIVLDALDECGDSEARRSLLKILRTRIKNLPTALRFFVTSRDESDFRPFYKLAQISVKTLDASHQSTNDINLYIRHFFAEMRDEDTLFEKDWPGEDVIRKMTTRASGLFIWVSTAMKFIEATSFPERNLQSLLDSTSESSQGIDELYGVALKNSVPSKDVPDLKRVLGAVVVARVPITDEIIDGIIPLPLKSKAGNILSKLGTVLLYRQGEPISFHHASFLDFLCTKDRSERSGWHVDQQLYNYELALGCLNFMSCTLRFNIANLENSFLKNDDLPSQVTEAITPPLVYAAQYCIHHFSAHVEADGAGMDEQISILLERVERLFGEQLLFWLEVMSLLRIMNRALAIATQATHIISRCGHVLMPKRKTIIETLVHDAAKFITTFEYPISQSTSHIYVSAVPFSPPGSDIYWRFSSHVTSALQVLEGGIERWTSSNLVMRDHTGRVQSIAYSPDGARIASGSDDNTVRIWDAKSGLPIADPLRGHTLPVTSIAYSPDGARIASGSDDKTVRIWDAKSGLPIGDPLRGHTLPVTSIAYSPDGACIASGSGDNTVRIWDLASEESMAIPNPVDLTPTYTDTSILEEDGWITSPKGELLFWIPLECRTGLWRPSTHFILGARPTHISVDPTLLGPNWAKCWRSDSSDVATK